MSIRTLSLCTLVALVFGGCGTSAPAPAPAKSAPPALGTIDQWVMPPAKQANPAQLPRLAGELKLDGDLAEWSSAVAIPLRARTDIVYVSPKHTWNGPADCSMELYAAWNEQGLCLAAKVADDDVFTDRLDKDLWQQDCIELFVDGRGGDDYMSSVLTPGFYQMFVRPPVGGAKADLVVNDRDGKIAGLKIAAKPVAGGYQVEMVIPWAALPGCKPQAGGRVAFAFSLDDYDRRDGENNYNFVAAYQGRGSLFNSPQKLIDWVLADKLDAASPANSPSLEMVVPGVIADPQGAMQYQIGAELPAVLTAQTASVRVSAISGDGKTLLASNAILSPAAAPWDSSRSAMLTWPPSAMPNGVHRVVVEALDKSGAVIARNERPVVVTGQTDLAMIAEIDKANLAALSQTEPFKACAYLGAASAIERYKRAVDRKDTAAVASLAREVIARLDVLRTGKVVGKSPWLLSALELAAEPDSQVSVEIDGEGYANVIFYWGNSPLVLAGVNQYATADAARKAMAKSESYGIFNVEERGKLGDLDVVRNVRIFKQTRSSWGHYDGDKQFLVIRGTAYQVDPKLVGLLSKLDAVVILPECSDAMKKVAESLAKSHDASILPLAKAQGLKRIAVFGQLEPGSDEDKHLTGLRPMVASVEEVCRYVSVLAGDRVVVASCPSIKAAEMAASLIAAGRPIKPADVDAIRKQLVSDVKPAAPASQPSNFGGMKVAPAYPAMRFRSGDIHMHTFYSDGGCTPAEEALECMYDYMDLIAITDHNTIDGAKLAVAQFAQCGINFPIVVGEELTTGWVHMNAWPITACIDPLKLSAYEMIQSAHAQGAAIQWNHPGYPGSDWDSQHLQNGPGGTGLDAVEHIDEWVFRWAKMGIDIPFTGTSDCHNHMFGWNERTFLMTPAATGGDLAEAVRRGALAVFSDYGSQNYYGAPLMVARLWAELADGQAMKARKADDIRQVLRKADVGKLLRISAPKAIRDEKK